jgi:hypothetical protein
METHIYSLINLAYLTTGRRLFALKKCLEVAQSGVFPGAVPLIEAAIAHDTLTTTLEAAWDRSRHVSQARGSSMQLDNQIDGLLGFIYSKLSGNIPLFEPDDPLVTASARIIDQLFPEGVHPITTLPFEEQLVKNQTIIDRLNGDLGDAVATTHIGPYVARLESLNDQFRAQLDQSQTQEITYEEVEAARDRGNLYVRQIAAVVLGNFHQDTEEAAGERQALLKPFLDQAERIRRSRKGRRAPQDVDPETGDEVAADESAA